MRKLWTGLVILALGAFLAVQAQTQTGLTAQEILEKSVKATYPEIFVAISLIENIKPGEQTQSYKLQIFKEGSDKTLIEILEPETEKGQKILRVGDDIKIFFPDICKLLPLGTKTSLLGTIFSYGDIARLDLVQDYDPTLIGTETVNGRPAYKLELKAKDETIAYATALYWVDVETFLPLRAEFYTLSAKLLKFVTYTEPKELAGAIRPSKIIMESILEAGAKTIMTILEMELKEDLPDELFTEEYHTKGCAKEG